MEGWGWPFFLEGTQCSVTTSSDGLIFVKRRAKDGRVFSKNTGVRRAKRRAKFKLCIKYYNIKDGQNYENTGVRRAILPKRPSRRANPSLDGRLSNTAGET